MARWVNRVCDGVFNYFGFGAHKGAGRLQFFLCFLNVVFSVWPIFCYVVYAKDIHVIYWLGKLPQFVNLSVPICLVCLNLGVNFFQCFHVRPKAARTGCVMLFMVLGSVLMAAGSYVTMQAEEVTTNLVRTCGQDRLSAALQETWTNCKDFLLACDPNFDQNIESCSGFSEQLFQKKPDPENNPDTAKINSVYYNYLVDTEFEFDCSGFCEFYAKPVWNKLADGDRRCSSAIAKRVSAVSLTVGMPTAGIGMALFLVGLMLAGYDHL